MLYFLRHALSVTLLPGTVLVVIPLWIARRYGVDATWPRTAGEIALAAAGLLLLAPGLTLFGSSLRRFFTTGRGTLAPWDPPSRLVVAGPYRYVRNPMISGVIFMLLAIALLLRSRPHGAWAGIFIAINAIYIPLVEEPDLAARFGEDYAAYRRNVRRFVPRLTPWSLPAGGRSPLHEDRSRV
jgi:protein-S-isoprenylcysteine O-methyltransferase Ste14